MRDLGYFSLKDTFKAPWKLKPNVYHRILELQETLEILQIYRWVRV